MGALALVLDHAARLLEGLAPATYAIPAGRFAATDLRTPIDAIPDAGATRRYEVLWSRVEDGIDGTPSNVSGTIVDATAVLELRVAYHAGGGTMDAGDRAGVARAAAVDWHYIRRCLVLSENWTDDTGVTKVDVGEARLEPARGEQTLTIMTIPVLVQYQDTWTEEPEA